MSFTKTMHSNNFSAQNIPGERMSALVKHVAQAISAEAAQALLDGDVQEPTKTQQQVAEQRGRKAKTVGQVVQKHFAKQSPKERRRIAGALMTRDILTGNKLSKSDRSEMKTLFHMQKKTPVFENEFLMKRLTRVLKPVKPIKKGDIIRWNAHWNGILSGVADGPGSSSSNGSGSAPQSHSQLQFRLHEVICNDDTNEVGRDEIAVGAVSVSGTLDENDNVTEADTPEIVTPHDMGQFRTGDSRTLGPLTLETFTLPNLEYPRLFLVNLALAEVDHGGFASFLQDLYEAIDEYLFVIIAAVATAIGGAIGAGAAAGSTIGAVAGPIGMLIGAAIGVILGAIVGAIAAAARDEIFEVQQCAISIPSPTALFNGSNESPVENVSYLGFGGEYTLRYNWRLT